MEYENLTPFSALVYDIVDPHGEESSVVVARGTYDLRAAKAAGHDGAPPISHVAALAEEQAELAFSDVYFGEMNQSSVRCESDLAQHKPRCDVIVIGSAHSPTGAAVARVDVGIRIRRRAASRDAPRGAPPPSGGEDKVLLDHHLVVHGPRVFERRKPGWVLTDPEPFVDLPLRYEHAFGGDLKVYASDAAAERLDDAHRLGEEARRKHPEGEAAPVAHATCLYNPLGVGYLEGWYADAAEVDRWPAPRIEAPAQGITADVFGRMVEGRVRAGELPALSPVGVGVVAKPWQPRLKLAGTFDERWLAERWPWMPPDFDMAYWNGAHPGMQCEHLAGAELVELWNLLPRSAPGTEPEGAGTACRFQVPEGHLVVELVGEDGDVTFTLAPIDTLILDLEAMRLSIVWRVVTPGSRRIEAVSLLLLDDVREEDTA